MHKVRIAEWILSLVTEQTRAGALAGDLAEESAARGLLWFWISLTRTGSALLWSSFAVHFGRLLSRSVAAFLMQLLADGLGGLLVFEMFALKIPTWNLWYAGWIFPALGTWASAVWLARRSPGQELASSLLCNAVGFVTAAALIATFTHRIQLPALNGNVLLDFGMIPIAIYVRRQRVRRAHA